MANCVKCGKKNPDKARFCMGCGNDLKSKDKDDFDEEELKDQIASDMTDYRGWVDDIISEIKPDEGREEAKQSLSLPRNKTIFLTVRNLVPRMGLENLIRAFHQSNILKQKAILLIGGRGPLEDHLKATVERFNLNKTVQFLGRIPENELPSIYQAADFFVLPTEKLEGFGLVIAESMASGTPVLGTPVGAIPEVIGQFDKRLIFDGTGSSDIQKKLEEVIEQPDRYNFSREKCRRFIEENYSWKKVADDFEKVAMGLTG